MGNKDQKEHGPASKGPETLRAPWRSAYMDQLDEAALRASQSKEKGRESCFLRAYALAPEHDTQNHVIVRRGEPTQPDSGMILLNRYPYANGHLLVALCESRPTLADYESAQRASLWSLIELASELCHRTLHPQGVNIGINQGAAAGAGVPEHLHAHVVPRWHGDVNFMTVVGNVRVISKSLDEMAKRYREVWEQLRV